MSMLTEPGYRFERRLELRKYDGAGAEANAGKYLVVRTNPDGTVVSVNLPTGTTHGGVHQRAVLRLTTASEVAQLVMALADALEEAKDIDGIAPA